MLTKNIPHTFVRNGYYYFSRRVPSDLRDHYSYHRIVQGLRTTSPQKAKVQASITSAQLEAYWSQLRLYAIWQCSSRAAGFVKLYLARSCMHKIQACMESPIDLTKIT